MPIYTLCLSTIDFGTADLLYNSLQIVLPILTMCMSEAVFRFTLDNDANPVLVFTNGIKVMLIGYAIIVPVGGIIFAFTQETYWLLFTCLIIVESLKSYVAQFTRALDKAMDFAASGIIGSVVLLGSTYYFLYISKLSISGYLLSFIVSDVVALAYLYIRGKINQYWDCRIIDYGLIKTMLAYSVPLVPNLLSWWITNVSSRYVVAGCCGLSLAGLFASASKIPAIINVVSSVFQQSWQFATIKEYQENKESDFYTNVFNQYSMFTFIFCAIITLLIPWISKFILLGDFYIAWKYTPLLLYSALLGCFTVFFGTFYSVVKKSTKVMTSTIVGAVLNILLCVILIPYISVWGALIANVASYIAVTVIRIHDVRKYIRLNANWIRWITCLIGIIIQSIAVSFELDSRWAYSLILLTLILIAFRKELAVIIIQNK